MAAGLAEHVWSLTEWLTFPAVQPPEHPKAWPVLEGEVRRCQTSRFPYGVLYSQEFEGVFILAVMHLHRDPDYWKHRIG